MSVCVVGVPGVYSSILIAFPSPPFGSPFGLINLNLFQTRKPDNQGYYNCLQRRCKLIISNGLRDFSN